jgi:hypothetical protein
MLFDRLLIGSATTTWALSDFTRDSAATRESTLDETARRVLRPAIWRVTEPARMLTNRLIALFDPGQGAARCLHSLLTVLWAVVVWGIVGGALARMTLIQLCRLRSLGTIAALRFAFRFAVPLITTPLFPIVTAGLCALICAGVGALFWLPAGIGGLLGGCLLLFPLVLGFVMSVFLGGLLACWPLMHASVAAEAEDVLDALSRSFSYLNQRTGKFVALAAIAWLIAVPGVVAADLLALSTVHLACWGTDLAAPGSSLSAMRGLPPSEGLSISQAAASIQHFWRGCIDLLVQGWVYAYFWTSASIIYLILRNDVDGTVWTEVKETED